MENAELEFTPDALKAIAREAMKRDTGARALRAVIEEIMLDMMYELPEAKDEGAAYDITADMVDAKVKPTLFAAKKAKKESA